MQEGIISLMQMPRTVAAVELIKSKQNSVHCSILLNLQLEGLQLHLQC